jgi:hypothetical protein
MWEAKPDFDEKDAEILARREALYNARPGPRVGDFVFLPGETEPRRFTHAWDDVIQTTSGPGAGGSFHLGEHDSWGAGPHEAYVSFSGSLARGVSRKCLQETNETKRGGVWFFHHGFSGANRGVDASMDFRVFRAVGASDG